MTVLRRRLSESVISELERMAAMHSGYSPSMTIGLVDENLVTEKVVRLVGRAVEELNDAEPQILMPKIFEEYLQPAFIKVAYGGRGSAKTQSFIRIILARMQATTFHVGCFREIQKSIADSIKTTIETVINDIGIRDQFYITKTEISCPATGSKMVFAGLKHNTTNIKGMDWIDCAFCEEAENISADSWGVLEPTLRKDGAELMVCYNPRNILDATHQRFVINAPNEYTADGRRYAVIKKVNHEDNPFFTDTSRRQMEQMREDDPEMYRHIWLGEPVADGEFSIIQPMWIRAAIDAHIKLGMNLEGTKSIGFDVADEGPDMNATVMTHGVIVTDIREWRDSDPNSAALDTFNYAVSQGSGMIIYDNIGVGAGAKGSLREQVRIMVAEGRHQAVPLIEGFNAGAAVNNPRAHYMPGKSNADMFYNLKAQSWWELRDRFYNTWRALDGKEHDANKLISLSSDCPLIDKLAAELSQPRREFLNGKFRVESKDAMRKRGVKSPNIADALVMAFSPVAVSGYNLSAW